MWKQQNLSGKILFNYYDFTKYCKIATIIIIILVKIISWRPYRYPKYQHFFYSSEVFKSYGRYSEFVLGLICDMLVFLPVQWLFGCPNDWHFSASTLLILNFYNPLLGSQYLPIWHFFHFCSRLNFVEGLRFLLTKGRSTYKDCSKYSSSKAAFLMFLI